MPERAILARFLFSVLVCALALPIAGWATGQSRFAKASVAFFDDGYPATASVATRGVGDTARVGMILVELRGPVDSVYSRERTVFRVTATDEEGVLIRHVALSVDFGDGSVEEFPLDRRTDIEHTWKRRGSYKMEFHLVGQDGSGSRGKMRVRVGGPLRVFLQVLGDEDAQIDEEMRYRFVALAREGRKVQGILAIDWGDGTTTRVSHFDGDVLRGHTYTDEGAYVITATITYGAGTKQKSRTFKVEVTDIGGPIDLRQATIAINSARDIANFKITSTVTNVTISGSQICIFHTKAGMWPVRDGAEGNPWVAAFLNGKLHAGTYEWLRPGQVCKGITRNNIGPHIKHGSLASWAPKAGETVYFWVSTLARLGSRTIDEMAAPFAKVWP